MSWIRPPALVAERNPAIEGRLDVLEDKEPLDLDDVEVAVARMRSPRRLRAELGEPVQYAQRVESEVAGLGIEVLLPHASQPGDAVGRFLATWEPDERRHAAALDLVLDRLGLESHGRPAGDDGAVPVHNRVLGVLGRLVPRAYEIVSLAYHCAGAVNERLALGAYTRMAAIARDVGEHQLADRLFDVLRRDESVHLGYYRTHARQLRTRLAPWQRRSVRAVLTRTYSPVGAGHPDHKAQMGRVLEVLEDDPDHPEIGPAVDRIACELLAEPDVDPPPFVADALLDCLRRARSERGVGSSADGVDGVARAA